MSLSPGITCLRVKSKMYLFFVQLLYGALLAWSDIVAFHWAAWSFVPWNSAVKVRLLIIYSHLFMNHGSPLWSHLSPSCTLLIQPRINPSHASEFLQELTHRDCVDFKIGFWQHSETWSQEAVWKKVCHSYGVLTDKQAAASDQPSFFCLTSAQMRCHRRSFWHFGEWNVHVSRLTWLRGCASV